MKMIQELSYIVPRLHSSLYIILYIRDKKFVDSQNFNEI